MQNQPAPKKKHTFSRILTAVLCVFALLIVSFVLYAELSTYRADETALNALNSTDTVTVIQNENGSIAFIPSDPVRGLIFYPGGLVEQSAYAPLMQRLAQDGTLCVLLRMPLQLAILNGNAADGIAAGYPAVSEWYIGGHSLGGLMAAGYAAKHPEAFKGVLMLGAYTTSDLSASGMRVACVYGSQDGVMNRTNYQKYFSLLPADVTETVIPGGNHAGFGSYGAQKKDLEAQITQAEQWDLTAEAFLALTKD